MDQPIEPKKGSQKARILQALREANGAWLPTNYFIRELGFTQPHARMTELEEDGWPIEHSPSLNARGWRSYRLVEAKAEQMALSV
jgi:hypothetical protein